MSGLKKAKLVTIGMASVLHEARRGPVIADQCMSDGDSTEDGDRREIGAEAADLALPTPSIARSSQQTRQERASYSLMGRGDE